MFSPGIEFRPQPSLDWGIMAVTKLLLFQFFWCWEYVKVWNRINWLWVGSSTWILWTLLQCLGSMKAVKLPCQLYKRWLLSSLLCDDISFFPCWFERCFRWTPWRVLDFQLHSGTVSRCAVSSPEHSLPVSRFAFTAAGSLGTLRWTREDFRHQIHRTVSARTEGKNGIWCPALTVNCLLTPGLILTVSRPMATMCTA